MSVAPSFQNFKFLTEPFEENNKWYIKVQNPKTLTIRKVRWYLEKNASSINPSPHAFTLKDERWKHARGFRNNLPIKQIRNYTPSEEETYLKTYKEARYAKDIGWYLISTEDIPSHFPCTFKYNYINWEDFVNVYSKVNVGN